MDEYLAKVRSNLSQQDKMEKLAMQYIIKFNFLNNLYGKDKIIMHDDLDDDLEDAYNTEDKMAKDIIPGNIYAFIYSPKSLIQINKGGISFSFADKLPILFCTEASGDTIKGINLNFCSLAVRACILNEITNLNSTYFNNSGPQTKMQQNKNPISNKVESIFGSAKNLSNFYQWMDNKYKLKRNDIVYRSYSINRIKRLRLIELWCWPYIPFLNYKGTLKQYELQVIHNLVSNFSKNI